MLASSPGVATAQQLPFGPLDVVRALVAGARWLVAVPLLAGAAGLGLTYLIQPTFTAKTTFLVPQQQGGAATAALASLGALAGLAGGATGMRSTAEQYVSLTQSDRVSDAIIEKFGLMDAYRATVRVDAREMLVARTRVELGKKDGIISIEVDDSMPARAASIANQYVVELTKLTGELTLTEAQQRRRFFEGELKQARDRLSLAQQALQASGFSAGALRAEPRGVSEFYARARAELTAASARLRLLQMSLSDQTPEVQQQQALVAELRSRLAREEQPTTGAAQSDYVTRYREFKYQETLFEMFARQFELARLDEARDSTQIQVIDQASPPERRSRPKRVQTASVTALAALLVIGFALVARRAWLHSAMARPPAGS